MRATRRLFFAALLCAACTRFELARGPAPVALDSAIARAKGAPVRLEFVDGRLDTFYDLKISGDSVSGATERGQREVMAVRDVRRVEVGGYSRKDTKTLMTFLIGLPLLGLLTFLVALPGT